ncbi:unnamed protein product [Chrysoparadoxa australica]
MMASILSLLVLGLSGIAGFSMVASGAHQGLDRRTLFRECAVTVASIGLSEAALAAESGPLISDKVEMTFAIDREPAGKVVLGLYGKEAPETAANFVKVVEVDTMDPHPSSWAPRIHDLNAYLPRHQGLRGSIDYNGSSVFCVEKGKRVDLGKLQGGLDKYEVRRIDNTGHIRRETRNAAEDLISSDKNDLKHDVPYVASMRKGGKTFEFTIASQANPELDENNVVFGRVLSGFDIIDRIESVPVTRDDPLGSKKGFSKAGAGFDPRAKVISLNRPLQKITMVTARVVGK